MKTFLFSALICICILITAAPVLSAPIPEIAEKSKPTSALAIDKNYSLKEKLKALTKKSSRNQSDALIFDLPVTYNKKVSNWIHFYQTRGRKWFREWLERSSRHMPPIQKELQQAGLPQDLAYMVMIESGFSATAVSSAQAVGPWQFIESTGLRYGLNRNWWLDERRDYHKSTIAATKYLRDLYTEFGSWYLVAASYNMGENGLRKKITKHGTKDFWNLIRAKALPLETEEYVPKILAAMLIAKAPNLYGFRNLEPMNPLVYDVVAVPGGTDLDGVADHLGITRKSLKDLNAELLLGYVPRQVERHLIRIPFGAQKMVTDYLQQISQKVAWK